MSTAKTLHEFRQALHDAAYETVSEPSAPGAPPNTVSRLRLQIGDEGTFYRSGPVPESGRSMSASGVVQGLQGLLRGVLRGQLEMLR